MSGPVLKKCFNCRTEMAENYSGLQCPKCQKNEARYGKATTCQYCQLNAAFLDKKCVWCTHAERKFGPPTACAHCKLICAFPRREREKNDNKAKLLCRRCIQAARSANQTNLSGVPVPVESKKENNPASTSTQHHKQKSSQKRKHQESNDDRTNRSNGPSSSSSTTNPTTTASSAVNNTSSLEDRESSQKIQKMTDEINRLKSMVQTKDQTIAEKEKQITDLKAEKYHSEKKHREKVHQLMKEKEESIRMVEQLRDKAKKT